MSMLTREFNYMRKAQRLDILLMVQLGDSVYKAADWSMTGIGLLDCPEDIQIGDRLQAKLVLPIANASINIAVEIECKNRRDSITGFEFIDLANRNKRVLRHYVELSLEGKLDNIEDLVADFSVPDIETPIKEALNITEEEQTSLLRKFRSRAFLTMTAGFLLMGYILFTLIYNLVFVYKTVGVVSGDLIQITASTSGALKKHYVKVADEVHVNDILFDLDDSPVLEALRKNDEQILQQSQLLEQLEQNETTPEASRLLTLLHEEFQRKEKEYNDAEKLFAQRVISVKDYQYVENSFSRARINYYRELEQQQASRQTLLEKQRLLALKIDMLKMERKQHLQRLDALRVRSPINGSVFTIDYYSGEYLNPNDVVVTLAGRENPFVLFKMPSKQSGRAQLGMMVKVYSFESGQTYAGTISSIGYSAINPRSTLLQEVSLEQTVIKVDLVGQDLNIPLNSRVEVWVQKKVPVLSRLLEHFNAPGEN